MKRGLFGSGRGERSRLESRLSHSTGFYGWFDSGGRKVVDNTKEALGLVTSYLVELGDLKIKNKVERMNSFHSLRLFVEWSSPFIILANLKQLVDLGNVDQGKVGLPLVSCSLSLEDGGNTALCLSSR
jgi:hypothetical protein